MDNMELGSRPNQAIQAEYDYLLFSDLLIVDWGSNFNRHPVKY